MCPEKFIDYRKNLLEFKSDVLNENNNQQMLVIVDALLQLMNKMKCAKTAFIMQEYFNEKAAGLNKVEK